VSENEAKSGKGTRKRPGLCTKPGRVMRGYEASSDLIADITMRERPETPLRSLIYRKEKVVSPPPRPLEERARRALTIT